MKFKALIEHWQKNAGPVRTETAYAVRLPLVDAAQLHALSDLFPGRSVEQLITDLLHSSLEEVAGAMPYQPGPKVISQDEHGDPIYEDVGFTPKFLELARKYKKSLPTK